MSRVVVTGAAGYLGPHVVQALADRGHDVVAAVRREPATQFDARAEIVVADILSPAFDLADWGRLPDAVVHLAWRDGFVHDSPAHMGQLSAHAGLVNRLAEAGVGRIVALGTMHEIGYWEGAIDAATPTDPISQYGIAKDALRRSLLRSLDGRTSFAWARAFYIHGDDRRNRSIFARLLQTVDEGGTSQPFTSGRNRYDFLRVDELGRQLAALTDATDVVGTINVATGEPVALGEMVERFIADNALPVTLEYGAFPDRAYDSPGVWADVDVIREVMTRG